ncbi:protein ORF74 [Cyprinid herpesvirus 3]|uniref:ORF74L n=1 Tax=Cyprinid herpesvirus 3 TaxID=180230 RepID=A3QMP2_CYHV3|nr:unnamed protein product [Cyprinid herpesvirus 3]ABC55170.1 hypothetical protein [Cyprinid herpesvirus 3]ABG42901.1 protein ORF74 [Cyprinid herpesvirus 3]AIC32429.1 ORF74L [Cyprinid herpesvirus 3]AJP55562.1 protein ORF74 [Cyprinid herpesvirus 3]AJP55717.1 protein ORF74 [Cyprinid herpesvirus 3]
MDTHPSIYDDILEWPGVPENDRWVQQTSSHLREKINALEEDLRSALDAIESSRSCLTSLLIRYDPEFRVIERGAADDVEAEKEQDFSVCTYTLADEIEKVRLLYFGEGCEWRCRYDSECNLLGCFPALPDDPQARTASEAILANFESRAKRLGGEPRSVVCAKTLEILKRRCLSSLTLNSRFFTSQSL